MKVVVLLGEGLGGEPLPDLNGKTALEAARTPHLDAMAARGILGLTRFVPSTADGLPDVAMLAALGYDPMRYRLRRGTLEAAARERTLVAGDVAFCADLVSLTAKGDGTELLSGLAGGDVDPATAHELGQLLAQTLDGAGVELLPSAGTRHLLVWHGGETQVRTTSPSAVLDQPLAPHLPSGPGADLLRDLMRRAAEALAQHPAVSNASANGSPAPNALWLWGGGASATLPSFRTRAGGPTAAVVTTARARGLATIAGMPVIDASVSADPLPFVERALADVDVTFVELNPFAGHDRPPRAHDRADAIERLDERLVGPVLERLRATGADWRVLMLCSFAEAADQPVPFVLGVAADEQKTRPPSRRFHERDAREQGIFIPEAHSLMERLLRRG